MIYVNARLDTNSNFAPTPDPGFQSGCTFQLWNTDTNDVLSDSTGVTIPLSEMKNPSRANRAIRQTVADRIFELWAITVDADDIFFQGFTL